MCAYSNVNPDTANAFGTSSTQSSIAACLASCAAGMKTFSILYNDKLTFGFVRFLILDVKWLSLNLKKVLLYQPYKCDVLSSERYHEHKSNELW